MIIRHFLGYKKVYNWEQNTISLNLEDVSAPDSAEEVNLFVDETNNNMLSYKNYENEVINIMEGEIEE